MPITLDRDLLASRARKFPVTSQNFDGCVMFTSQIASRKVRIASHNELICAARGGSLHSLHENMSSRLDIAELPQIGCMCQAYLTSTPTSVAMHRPFRSTRIPRENRQAAMDDHGLGGAQALRLAGEHAGPVPGMVKCLPMVALFKNLPFTEAAACRRRRAAKAMAGNSCGCAGECHANRRGLRCDP